MSGLDILRVRRLRLLCAVEGLPAPVGKPTLSGQKSQEALPLRFADAIKPTLSGQKSQETLPPALESSEISLWIERECQAVNSYQESFS